VHVLYKLSIQVALSVYSVLVELSFVNQHFCFEHRLLFLGLGWQVTEHFSCVDLCNCAISVLLLDSDNNFASSCLFLIGHLQ